MRDGARTIPVPHGWSPEQSWEHIRRGDLLADPDPWWAVILVRDGSMLLLLDESSSPLLGEKWRAA